MGVSVPRRSSERNDPQTLSARGQLTLLRYAALQLDQNSRRLGLRRIALPLMLGQCSLGRV
jgi:hypothetical protein